MKSFFGLFLGLVFLAGCSTVPQQKITIFEEIPTNYLGVGMSYRFLIVSPNEGGATEKAREAKIDEVEVIELKGGDKIVIFLALKNPAMREVEIIRCWNGKEFAPRIKTNAPSGVYQFSCPNLGREVQSCWVEILEGGNNPMFPLKTGVIKYRQVFVGFSNKKGGEYEEMK